MWKKNQYIVICDLWVKSSYLFSEGLSKKKQELGNVVYTKQGVQLSG